MLRSFLSKLLLLLVLSFCVVSYGYSLTPQEKATLTGILQEYKQIQLQYSLQLTALQNQQLTDKQSLSQANQLLQSLNSQIETLQTQAVQDKLSLTNMTASTADLKQTTKDLKTSLNKVLFENTLLKVALPVGILSGAALGYFFHK